MVSFENVNIFKFQTNDHYKILKTYINMDMQYIKCDFTIVLMFLMQVGIGDQDQLIETKAISSRSPTRISQEFWSHLKRVRMGNEMPQKNKDQTFIAIRYNKSTNSKYAMHLEKYKHS